MVPLIEGVTTTGSDAGFYLSLTDSRPLVNVDNFRSGNPLQGSRPEFSGIDGRGFGIVVLDSGIDADHPFFGVDADGNDVADRIVYQQDFAYDDMQADDRLGHGTHVTSIAASEDAIFTGMAPAANIISLKVSDDADSRGFNGIAGDVEQALQWIIDHAEEFNIASINMSLGDGGNYQTPQTLYGLGDELAALTKKNVIVVSASGNGFSGTEGVAYPSADPNSLSVGAVFDGGDSWNNNNTSRDTSDDFLNPPGIADQITGYSQRDRNLTDIFAPGSVIAAAGSDIHSPFYPELRVNNTNVLATQNGTHELPGTSMAAPHIAGMAVLAQQLAQQELNRQLTPDEFRRYLYAGGISINDPATGITTFRRANMLGLADQIMNQRPPSDRNIDLSATRFDVVQSGLNIGSSATVNFQIQNAGLDDSGSFNISFYLSDDSFISSRDTLLDSISIGRIARNSNTGLLSRTLTLPNATNPIWRSFGSGSGYIGMIVDRLNAIGETNENNNSNLGLSLDSDNFQVNKQGSLTFTLNRLSGDFDGFLAGTSDFYARFSAAENPFFRSPMFNRGEVDVEPNYPLVPQPVIGSSIPIVIQAYDDDNGTPFYVIDEPEDLEDFHVDLDPREDRDVNLVLNLFTGEITGDVTGTAEIADDGTLVSPLLYSGTGTSEDNGQIWFTIAFSPTL